MIFFFSYVNTQSFFLEGAAWISCFVKGTSLHTPLVEHFAQLEQPSNLRPACQRTTSLLSYIGRTLVCPPKKGSQADVSNYRPISLLSIPSKLLESQICSLIDNYLNSRGTKSRKQWGFTKGLSTEGMLISMTEKWKMAIDNGRTVGAVFIDFQKAFYTVPHDILSYKLHAIGISGSIHE